MDEGKVPVEHHSWQPALPIYLNSMRIIPSFRGECLQMLAIDQLAARKVSLRMAINSTSSCEGFSASRVTAVSQILPIYALIYASRNWEKEKRKDEERRKRTIREEMMDSYRTIDVRLTNCSTIRTMRKRRTMKGREGEGRRRRRRREKKRYGAIDTDWPMICTYTREKMRMKIEERKGEKRKRKGKLLKDWHAVTEHNLYSRKKTMKIKKENGKKKNEGTRSYWTIDIRLPSSRVI